MFIKERGLLMHISCTHKIAGAIAPDLGEEVDLFPGQVYSVGFGDILFKNDSPTLFGRYNAFHLQVNGESMPSHLVNDSSMDADTEREVNNGDVILVRMCPNGVLHEITFTVSRI